MKDYKIERLQDFKIERLQDCKITRLQDFKIERLQDYKIERLQDCKIARLKDCKIERLQDYKIERLKDYKIKRLQDYKIKRLKTKSRYAGIVRLSLKTSVTIFLFILLGIIQFNFSGCIPSKPTEEIELLPSERLLKKLEANRRKIKNFEGMGSLTINTPEMNATASFKVILQKPDSLYFEIYGPFGIDLAQALVTDKSFTFYDIMHNRVYQGKNESEALKNILKVDIDFRDLMDAFTGAVNLTPKLAQEPNQYDVIYDKYVLTYNDSITNITTKYFVDVRELAITEYQLINARDKVFLDGSFSKFNLKDNVPIPFNTHIKYLSNNQSIKIEYRKAEINKNNTKLTLQIPDDAEIVDW